MPVYLILAATVIVACIVFHKISNRLGVPMLLAFILLGMLFGSDGLIKIPFDNYVFAEQICSIALIFIMFYGGFGTKWSEARPVAVKAILLSSFGTVLTAGFVGMFCYFALKIPLLESFLIGSVISSTDAASVFSILRSKRLNLKDHTASMLELESGSNDPFSYMLTALILSLMNAQATAGSVLYLLFAQIVYGVLFGVLIAGAALLFMKKFPVTAAGFDAMFVLAAAVFSYALPAALGGNGYLSAYLAGIILGNSRIRNKQPLVHFFDGATAMMQMLLFFLLGLLSFPSQLPKVASTAIFIALFLTFAARPLAVFLLLSPFKAKSGQMLLVSWAGMRGAASIVFAVMAVINPATTNNDIFHIVFFIVLFSILLQGSLIPMIAEKLKMTDSDADVMKTFTDYSGEGPLQFLQFVLPSQHPWIDQKVRDITLPPDALFVLLQRGEKRIIPNGKTVLQAGDLLVLSARAADHGIKGVHLFERCIDKQDSWLGKRLSELPDADSFLIIMIKRGDKTVIPDGSTMLQENDVLVINHMET